MSKKILLCADSFGVTDPGYPGVHFSEKIKKIIPDCEIINFSRGGSSNSLIELQVHQGLMYNPDYVIVLFTDLWRTDYILGDSNFFNNLSKEKMPELRAQYKDTEYSKVLDFNNQTYMTTAHYFPLTSKIPASDTVHSMKANYENSLKFQSHDLNCLRQYFIVLSILNLLKTKNIPMCFSLGGLDYVQEQDKYTDSTYQQLVNTILPRHFMSNEIAKYMDKSIGINLWTQAQRGNDGPLFHTEDENIQETFANECMNKLGLK